MTTRGKPDPAPLTRKVDIVNAIAQKEKMKLRIVNTPFTSIFASLNNGDVDFVISGVTINDKRK